MNGEGQMYVGVKQIYAYPEVNKAGVAGYHVEYRHGQPNAYHSWSPKEEFERFYLPMGEASDGSRVTPEMVDGFVSSAESVSVGGKMTVVNVELANGTLCAESSACVDPKNYDESIGKDICVKRAKDRVWHLLGFVLQWSRNGIKPC